jgi:hypothetical protein
MADHNEPCGCEESKRLRLDLANTIEDRDRVVTQTKRIAQLLGSSKDLEVSYDFGLEAQNLADTLRKDHDELKHAVCEYFESYAVVRGSALYNYYTTMDKPNRKIAKATKALKDAMMRSHMGETVSYEEMAQAVLDAVKEG